MTTTIITLQVFEDYIRTEIGAEDTQHNQSALNTATSAINNACQRQFVLALPSTTRNYVPSCSQVQRVHDFTTITAVTLDGATIDPATYQPEVADNLSLTGEVVPFEQVVRFWDVWWSSTPRKKALAVTGTPGWVAIPDTIIEACKVTGKALVELRNARGGVVSSDAFGPVRAPRDVLAQVAGLVGNYRRVEAFGIG